MGLSGNPSEPRTGGRISCELTFIAQAADPRAAKAPRLDPAASGADSGCELTVQTSAAETPPPARGTNARAAPDRLRPHLRPTPRGPSMHPLPQLSVGDPKQKQPGVPVQVLAAASQAASGARAGLRGLYLCPSEPKFSVLERMRGRRPKGLMLQNSLSVLGPFLPWRTGSGRSLHSVFSDY